MVATQVHAAAPAARVTRPEVENVIAHAMEKGLCDATTADVWRTLGESDLHKLIRLFDTMPSPRDLHAVMTNARRFFDQLDLARNMLVALKFAALGQEHAHEKGVSELHWPSVLDGLQRMLPEASRMEEATLGVTEAIGLLNAATSLHAARAAQPPAPRAKQTRRAAVAGASHPASTS